MPFYDLLPFHGIVGVPPPTEAMSLNSDYLWDFNDRDLAHYDLYNVRYVVAPTGLAMPEFLKPVQQAGPYTLYEAPTSGYAQFVNIIGWEPVANQEALFTRNRPWVNGNGPAQKNYIAYDYPSDSPVASGRPAPGCPDGGQIISEDVDLERFTFVVNCSVESPLVIKATYHPNWQVQIDGQPARTFMVSPSNIGLLVPAGQHTITAEYQATPIKTPLADPWCGCTAPDPAPWPTIESRVGSVGPPGEAPARPRARPASSMANRVAQNSKGARPGQILEPGCGGAASRVVDPRVPPAGVGDADSRVPGFDCRSDGCGCRRPIGRGGSRLGAFSIVARAGRGHGSA